MMDDGWMMDGWKTNMDFVGHRKAVTVVVGGGREGGMMEGWME